MASRYGRTHHHGTVFERQLSGRQRRRYFRLYTRFANLALLPSSKQAGTRRPSRLKSHYRRKVTLAAGNKLHVAKAAHGLKGSSGVFGAARLVRLLLETAAGGPDAPKLTQQEMAAQLGTVREMVARALKQLESRGLIESKGGRIVIVDRQTLEKMI